MGQKDLPKPLTDLPLPEKEISASANSEPTPLGTNNGFKPQSIFKSKVFLGFVGVSFLICFLVGGFVIGKNQASPKSPAIEVISETPTPTISDATSSADMTDWKIYKNPNLGISFEYPQNLMNIKDKLPITYTKNTTVNDILSIASNDINKNAILIWLNPRFDIGGCWPLFRYTAKQVDNKIVFEKATPKDYSSNIQSCDTFFDAFITTKNGDIFMINYDNNNSSNPTEFEKTLNSFRFTK